MIETINKEIADAVKDLPEENTRVWYFSLDGGYPQMLMANFVGADFNFRIISGMYNRKSPPIESYYLRTSQFSPIFKVNKIYPSHEAAIENIGGYTYSDALREVTSNIVEQNDGSDGAA